VAWYVAAQVEGGFYGEFVKRVCEEGGVGATLDVPRGVQVVVREGERGRFLFLLNHTAERVEVADGSLAGENLLTGEDCAGAVSLSARGAAVLRLRG
jgi:beta-galactosidase